MASSHHNTNNNTKLQKSVTMLMVKQNLRNKKAQLKDIGTASVGISVT